MGSLPAAPRPSRRSPWIGQAGRRHPVRMFLPSATGWPLACCRESYPFATPEDLAAAGREAFPHYPASIQDEGVGGWAYFNEDCREVWKVPAAPDALHQPVASSIPTLLISGSFDTLTGAKAAAAAWPKRPSSAFRASGISCSPASPCAQDVVVSFLADPNAPDISCVGTLKPASFASPASPWSAFRGKVDILSSLANVRFMTQSGPDRSDN